MRTPGDSPDAAEQEPSPGGSIHIPALLFASASNDHPLGLLDDEGGDSADDDLADEELMVGIEGVSDLESGEEDLF